MSKWGVIPSYATVCNKWEQLKNVILRLIIIVLSVVDAVRPIQTNTSHHIALCTPPPHRSSCLLKGRRNKGEIQPVPANLTFRVIINYNTDLQTSCEIKYFYEHSTGSQFWILALNLTEYGAIHYVELIYQSPDKFESTTDRKVGGHFSNWFRYVVPGLDDLPQFSLRNASLDPQKLIAIWSFFQLEIKKEHHSKILSDHECFLTFSFKPIIRFYTIRIRQ